MADQMGDVCGYSPPVKLKLSFRRFYVLSLIPMIPATTVHMVSVQPLAFGVAIARFLRDQFQLNGLPKVVQGSTSGSNPPASACLFYLSTKPAQLHLDREYSA